MTNTTGKTFQLYGLRAVRKNLNRTQEEVSSLTNFGRGAIQAIERKGRPVTEEEARQIATALGTSVAFLRQKPGRQTFIAGCSPDEAQDATEL
jgi:transcriptional regulator with XRE-family HTH domain